MSLSTDHMLSSSTGHFFYGHPAYGHGGGGGGHYLHHTETYPAIHEEHYYAPVYQDHEEEYHKQNYKGKGSDLSIKDFFEIALTALAFLSFGVFIIHLLMNATVYTGCIYIAIANSSLRLPPLIFLFFQIRVDEREHNHDHDDRQTSEKESEWIVALVLRRSTGIERIVSHRSQKRRGCPRS